MHNTVFKWEFIATDVRDTSWSVEGNIYCQTLVGVDSHHWCFKCR